MKALCATVWQGPWSRSPDQVCLAVLVGLGMSLVATQHWQLLALLVWSLALLVYGGVSLRRCWLWIRWPMLLSLISVAGLLISVDLHSSLILRFEWSVWPMAGMVWLRCVVMALLGWALVALVSFASLMDVLRRCRLPEELVDVVGLMYQTAYGIQETWLSLRRAQSLRLSPGGWAGLNAMAMAISACLGGVLRHSVAWERGLTLRGAQHGLRVLAPARNNSLGSWLWTFVLVLPALGIGVSNAF